MGDSVKNFVKNFYFIFLLLFMCVEMVCADVSLDNDNVIIYYLICGSFMLVGVCLIIYSKFNKGSNGGSYYDEEKKNEITGLKDKKGNKVIGKNGKKVDHKNLYIDSDFNFDSIFKILPSFSPNKILSDNFNKLKDEIMKDSHIKKVKLVDKRITYFEEIDNGYLMKVQYITEENYLDDDDKYDKKRKCKYEVILNNIKKDIALQTCPVCGGKIKDPTLLRCKFCGSILPVSDNSNNNTDEWTFEKHEKIDQI